MADQPSRIVVVGGGHAASSAVNTLRAEGYEGEIALISDEPHLPYERPPLSKAVLTEDRSIDELLTYTPEWYRERSVETILGRTAKRIDTADRIVELDDRQTVSADAILIATGSRPRTLPFGDDEQIRYLRTYADALRLREEIGEGRSVVVVGAGFIGAEVAAAARARGAEVTMLEMLDIPFSRVLGDDIGSVIGSIHREKGVDIRTGAGVSAIGRSNGLLIVKTTSGDEIEADVVVVGVGVIPNDELAQVSGLAIHDGILVDAGCATSAPGIYAAGDVVRHDHPLFGLIRVEHYDSAVKQGAVAARNMLGGGVVHADPPWFWSDQYEHNLQYAGHASTYDEVILRGASDSGEMVAFFLSRDRLVGCFGLNRGSDVRVALRLVGRDVAEIKQDLRDERTDLRAAVKAQLSALA
jgi:3-phenylpropionate/trans-cinnamate dioxygenase ferredoxin reductase subunit